MKATVLSSHYVPSVPGASGGLVVSFEQVVFDNFQDDYRRDVNALGLRLRRILLMHAPTAIIVAASKEYRGCAFLLERVKSAKGFENQAAAQRTINKYLNAKINVTFVNSGVFCSSGSTNILLKDITQVKQTWAQGKTVEIQVELQLSLPTQNVDYEAVKAVLPKGALVGGNSRERRISVLFEVRDATVAADPFALLKDFKSKILKVKF